MFSDPIKSKAMLDKYLESDYAIIFMVREDHDRLLEFRRAVNPAVWHLIHERLTNYTCVRLGWTAHLRALLKVKATEGVVFVKSKNLVKEMEGFKLEEFKKTLKEFEPHKKMSPPKEEKKNEEEKLHRLVFEAYPLMAHLDYLGISRYAVVHGDAYTQMSMAQNIAAPIGVALIDETNVACSFATFDKRVLGDYIELLFGDPAGLNQLPTFVSPSTTLVDTCRDSSCGMKNNAAPVVEMVPMPRTTSEIETASSSIIPPSLAMKGRSLSAKLFPKLVRRNTSR
ncbi:hypothetical protein EV175_000987 [Coemansia sp. RSA 1933]|nr:hypothetical protein EV175_000987 [Coemansia sp. RSA 1933]